MSADLLKGLSLLASLLLFGNVFLSRIVSGSWVSPGVVASAAWFCMTFIPIVLLWSLPTDPLALLYIFTSIFLFSSGGFFFSWRKAMAANSSVLSDERSQQDVWARHLLLFFAFCVCQVIVLICIPMNLHKQGFAVTDFFSLHQASGKYLELKYTGRIVSNIYLKLSIVLNYLGLMLGGYLLAFSRSLPVKSSVVVFSFMPSFLFMVMYADKGTLFLGIFIFYGALLAGRVKSNHYELIPKSVLKYFLLGMLVLVPAVISSFLSRGLDQGSSYSISERLLYSISSYMVAHLYAFSDWFSAYTGRSSMMLYLPSDAPFGYHTFTALMNWFGVHYELPAGYYDEYFSYPGIIQTNIYTAFRGLLTDFGFLGSLLFWFVAGIICHAAYYAMLAFKRPAVAVGIYVFMFGFLGTSHLLSLFVWSSVIVATALLVVILIVNGLFERFYKNRF